MIDKSTLPRLNVSTCIRKKAQNLVQLASDSNYLHRMICLAALRELGEADACHPDMLPNSLLPAITKLSSDAVPNVRFKVAQVLGKLAPFLNAEAMQNYVKPTLEKLGADSDADVIFYAKEAYESLSQAAR
ncbi:hypothetical protein ACTXT7_015002 [Hymenolepis weldensis]